MDPEYLTTFKVLLWFCCYLNLSTSSHTIRSPGVGFMPDILDVKAGEISHGDDSTKIKKKERVSRGSGLNPTAAAAAVAAFPS
ncbi:hypothetical protein L1987_33222 [Smallanthus sonchifolius]|uniref:Uncharacterized protein n=1 Tax=Smallanthus sonchifolius TaxID=185202 RepID=A0ACB9HQS3_9ASTR|nr:hypothetical protein L1987_33222 [Smallanthus sonchifolius]